MIDELTPLLFIQFNVKQSQSFDAKLNIIVLYEDNLII